jgi:hypothetical protein
MVWWSAEAMNRWGLMTVEHRWLLDETPWPEQATLVYGEMLCVPPQQTEVL